MYPDSQNDHDRFPDVPAAIFPSRLEWLCQPEQIEHTLRLLFCLSAWKRASNRLLYPDRQGLAEVQAIVLEQASKVGLVQPTTYLDGTARFPGELLLESAAENAARGVSIHLKGLRDPEIWPPFWPDGDRVYQQSIRPLYRRITGQDFPLVAQAAEALSVGQVRAYLQEQLDRLIDRAIQTRQPLSTRRLAALCISPIDLLSIRDNRLYFLDSYESWDELDESDRRKLDPEGYSQVAFAYQSASAEFVFHLPLRRTELFVPFERLRALHKTPGSSQERGVVGGVPLEDEESLARPAREILQDLGVEIAQVCPHDLVDKECYLAQPAIRDLLWPTRNADGEDWDNDPWFRGVDNISPK
jgi:hypothetical protein